MASVFALGLVFASAAGALALVQGRSPLGVLNVLLPEDGYTAEKDIAYGPHRRQSLDVYVPNTAEEGAPVVVFFYGGSWKSGHKRNYRFVAEALTRQGFVVVIPDYRLFPEVRFPTFVEDGAEAVRWVRENIECRGGDPRRVVLMGHSAGAHIAALLTWDHRYLAAAGLAPTVIRGLIGVSGPYAFDPLLYRSVRSIFVDAPDPEATRPVTFADGGGPPVLLLHGKDDRTVYPSNSTALAELIGTSGGEVRLIEYPDVGHIAILLAIAKPFRHWASVVDDTARFVDTIAESATN